MKINKEHLYHGAVLNQIAEHKQFTAINALKIGGKTSRSAFKVNDDIAVYLKYASEPSGSFREYAFTFNKLNLSELRKINNSENHLHLALVCVHDNEVCCFPYSELLQFIKKRNEKLGETEDQYVLLVTLNKNESFRVNMNEPGKKKIYLGDPLIVRRKACPESLFR